MRTRSFAVASSRMTHVDRAGLSRRRHDRGAGRIAREHGRGRHLHAAEEDAQLRREAAPEERGARTAGERTVRRRQAVEGERIAEIDVASLQPRVARGIDDPPASGVVAVDERRSTPGEACAYDETREARMPG